MKSLMLFAAIGVFGGSAVAGAHAFSVTGGRVDASIEILAPKIGELPSLAPGEAFQIAIELHNAGVVSQPLIIGYLGMDYMTADGSATVELLLPRYRGTLRAGQSMRYLLASRLPADALVGSFFQASLVVVPLYGLKPLIATGIVRGSKTLKSKGSDTGSWSSGGGLRFPYGDDMVEEPVDGKPAAEQEVALEEPGVVIEKSSGKTKQHATRLLSSGASRRIPYGDDIVEKPVDGKPAAENDVVIEDPGVVIEKPSGKTKQHATRSLSSGAGRRIPYGNDVVQKPATGKPAAENDAVLEDPGVIIEASSILPKVKKAAKPGGRLHDRRF